MTWARDSLKLVKQQLSSYDGKFIILYFIYKTSSFHRMIMVAVLTVLLKYTVLNCVKRWLSEKMALWDLDNV